MNDNNQHMEARMRDDQAMVDRFVGILDLEVRYMEGIEADIASCSDSSRLRELMFLYADARDGYRRAVSRVVHYIKNAHEPYGVA